MDFVAIDFETANAEPSSACAIGLVKCVSGQIYETKSALIRPPTLFFSDVCVRVHGLTARDVRTRPTFDILWKEELAAFIGGLPLVAHNAPFDRGVLEATLAHYGLAPPSVAWACTLQMARRYLKKGTSAYPQLSHRLNSVAAHFGIQFRHHDALEDSRAVTQIVLELEKLCGTREIENFFR